MSDVNGRTLSRPWQRDATHEHTVHPGGNTSRMGLALLIVVVSAFVQLRTGNFLSASNLETIILNVTSLLIAAAAAMRLLISGNVDLSIGGQLSLLSVVVALVARETQTALWPVIAGLVAGCLLGLFNAYAVRLLSISPIIVTLGLSFVYFGLAKALSDSTAVFGLPVSFLTIGLSRLAGIPAPVFVALVFFVLSALALTRTTGGVRRYAMGGNPAACRSEGIDVDRATRNDFVFMGFAMAIVAILVTARIQGGTSDIGVNFELEALTAVVVGGVAFMGGAGRPFGVFLAVILLGTIDAAMVFLGFADYYQQIAKGAILLLALGADQIARYRERTRRQASHADQLDSTSSADLTASTEATPLDVPSPGTVAVRVEDVSKSYGAVQAVSNISFDVAYGQVTCLLGDNGAGKSTLVKILAGALEPSSGRVLLNVAQEPDFRQADDPRGLGLETVWQDLAVCPNLGAAYNLSLGDEPVSHRWGPVQIFDRTAAEARARRRLSRLGVNLSDMFRPLADLSGGQRQSVSISRVLSEDARIVILDEPTAALGVHQTRNVVRLVQDLRAGGAAVILISHDLELVRELADHYVILNRGRLIADAEAANVTPQRVLHLMAGYVDESTSPSAVR